MDYECRFCKGEELNNYTHKIQLKGTNISFDGKNELFPIQYCPFCGRRLDFEENIIPQFYYDNLKYIKH